MFEFAEDDAGVGIVTERHYLLVQPEEIDADDLTRYGQSQLT